MPYLHTTHCAQVNACHSPIPYTCTDNSRHVCKDLQLHVGWLHHPRVLDLTHCSKSYTIAQDCCALAYQGSKAGSFKEHDVCGCRYHATRYDQESRQRLDIALLAVFQGFRKVYVGEQVMHSSKVSQHNHLTCHAFVKTNPWSSLQWSCHAIDVRHSQAQPG